MEKDDMEKILFPYSSARKVQEDLIKEVQGALKTKSHLIAHAPTGLGKTAATIAPALAYAIENEKTVFFLTSRHTQHSIAVKTLKEIKSKFKAKFNAASIIGKKWMCALPETENLYGADFADYCQAMKDDSRCEPYILTKKSGKPSPECLAALKELKKYSPVSTENVISQCNEKLCPYEVSVLLAAESDVIITDYYYILHPGIRETFVAKTGKDINDSIIIIDEGHNLPARARELLTKRMSSYMLKMAIKEAKKYSFQDVIIDLVEIQDIFNSLSENMKVGDEKLITKESFMSKVEKIKDYDEIQAELEFAADEVRENDKQSFIGSIAKFLEGWKGPDKGFCRIMSVKNTKYGPLTTLMHRCLDPSLLTKEIIDASHSTIIMSGTLSPASMYRDLLGFPKNTNGLEFPCPFPEKNRLALIVPMTTTKFTKRSPTQYKNIATITSAITNMVPGNSAVFFPSYNIRNEVFSFYDEMSGKKTILEKPGLSKEEKKNLLDSLMDNDNSVLMGVAAGSFGEGVDIPNNKLKAVVVVGLPLDRPDLETKELIKYYDEKFEKGWDYGYTMPAITKSLQNAGRCIRSETDKGLMVFLDERYAWPTYRKCFPKDWEIDISTDFQEKIAEFMPVAKKPHK